MGWIRRDWTPLEADEWTKEDWIAIVLSPIIYFILTLGVTLCFLLQWEGFALTGVGIVLLVVMFHIIDPKLRSISEEYEKKQKAYLEELEEAIRWKK